MLYTISDGSKSPSFIWKKCINCLHLKWKKALFQWDTSHLIQILMQNFPNLASFLTRLLPFHEIFGHICQEMSLCIIAGLGTLEPIRNKIPANFPEYPWALAIFLTSVSEGYKKVAILSANSFAILLSC